MSTEAQKSNDISDNSSNYSCGEYEQWIKNNRDLIDNACYNDEAFNLLLDEIERDMKSIKERQNLYKKIETTWCDKNVFGAGILDNGYVLCYRVERF